MEERRAIIFDVDGALVDSSDAHANSWAEALNASGIPIPFARIRPLIGIGADKLLPELVGITLSSALGRRINHVRSRIFESRLKNIRAFPGVRALVLRVMNAGHIPAVISTSSHDHLDRLLSVAEVGDLFTVRVLADTTLAGRPLSNLIFPAIQRLRVPASNTIAIAATPHDIAAAHRAGVSVIGLRCAGWDDHELMGAAAVYQDPAELLSRFDESPLSDRAFKES